MALKTSEIHCSLRQPGDEYAGLPNSPTIVPDGPGFLDMVALTIKSGIAPRINKKIIVLLTNATKRSNMPDCDNSSTSGSGAEMAERFINLITIFENKALDFHFQEVTA